MSLQASSMWNLQSVAQPRMKCKIEQGEIYTYRYLFISILDFCDSLSEQV